MPLSPGTRLGPYQLDALVGSGGMGEVYRARDTRLGREVAVKILPAAFAGDPDRLRRFEQEARAASQLNHPNILTVFDTGTDSGVFYLVSELLDGETLRARLESSPLPVRKAIDCGIQVAQAIAAAHEKGIVHRDLKPDNIFLIRDGRVKVVDFGLAKLREAEPAAAGVDGPTLATNTGAGVVLGTVGYMSPEQVRGLPADPRSDIFALGTVLYEMVSGRRAFHRGSAAETMTAIVREEPPPLEQSGVAVPPALGRIIDHCLEKNPDERFQSARDLAFGLRALSDVSGSSTEREVAQGFTPVKARRWAPALALALVALIAVAGEGFLLGRWLAAEPPLWFDKLTFRQGEIFSARFSSDGRAVFYSGRFGNEPEQTFVLQPGNPESRPLDLPPSRLLSVSKTGELAVMLNPTFRGGYIWTGTLARVPPTGGAPRELLEDVQTADWNPDGESLAVVRTVAGRARLEFPIGTVLFETDGWLERPRVAPGGGEVAVLHHPRIGDDAGEVMLVNSGKRAVKLSAGFGTLVGLAWAGDELLVTGALGGTTRRLYAVSKSGQRRLVAATAGALTVQDRAPDGRVLVSRESNRIGIAMRTPADRDEREASWLDWSLIRDISRDGKLIAFDETGEGGGQNGSVYLRRTDGSPAVRLGDGGWPLLSPDSRWVTCIQGEPDHVMILPTGAGESRRVATPGVTPLSAAWFPDGQRLLVAGNEPGHALRYYVVPLDGGQPKAVTPEGAQPFAMAISPDGRDVLTRVADGDFQLFPVDGGPAMPVEGLAKTDIPARMATPDSVYAYQRGAAPVTVALVDLKTGARKPIFTVAAGRSIEAGRPSTVRVSADGRSYAYSYVQSNSELFLMRKADQPR